MSTGSRTPHPLVWLVAVLFLGVMWCVDHPRTTRGILLLSALVILIGAINK